MPPKYSQSQVARLPHNMEPKSLDVAVQQVTGQNLVKVWLKFFQSVAKDLRNTVSQLPY